MSNAISAFREKVPSLKGEEVYFYSSAPANDIASDAIIEYIRYTSRVADFRPHGLAKVEDARAKFAKFINTSSENITFTRDTTEGSILFQKSINFRRGDNVVVLAGDFPHPIYGLFELEQSQGVEVRFVEVNEPDVKSYGYADFEPLIDGNTKLIALSSVMFHTGIKNDIKSLTDALRPRGIHVLVDGTQEIGFGKIDVKELGVSAMAFAIYKGLGSPTGTGILYVDPEAIKDLKPLPPILSTAGVSNVSASLVAKRDFDVHPNALRYEHDNKAIIQLIALDASLDYLASVGIENIETYLRDLGSYLTLELAKVGVKLVGNENSPLRSPHNYVLDLQDPAWDKLFKENKILLSHYRCGVRVSLGLYNNKEDIQKLVAVVKKGLENGLRTGTAT